MVKLPLLLTEEKYIDHAESDEGMCLSCGEIQSCCEPDASGYTCDSCEADKVMAFEQMLVEGHIEFIEASEGEE